MCGSYIYINILYISTSLDIDLYLKFYTHGSIYLFYRNIPCILAEEAVNDFSPYATASSVSLCVVMGYTTFIYCPIHSNVSKNTEHAMHNMFSS